MRNKLLLVILSISTLALILTGCQSDKSIGNNSNDSSELIVVEDNFKLPDEIFISEAKGITIGSFYHSDEYQKIAMKYIGKNYGDFKYLDHDGNEYDLADIDKPIIMSYLSPYCEACTMNIDPTNELIKKYPEYQVISVMGDRDKNGANIYKDKGFEEELYYISDKSPDKKVEYSSQGVPFYLFLDENKDIKLVHLGTFDSDYVEILIDTAFN